MKREPFRQQPAVWEPDCAPCDADSIRAAIVAHPGRPLWLRGGLNIDTAGDIGSVTADPATGQPGPVLLIVNGNVSFANSGATVFGLLYTRAAGSTISGSGRIQGAAVAGGNITFNGDGVGPLTVVRDSEVLQRLRNGTGSFVRVPGSWVDFK
jgi:hypothetical protein